MICLPYGANVGHHSRATFGAILGHHSHTQSSWRVAQGIACVADHLLVGFRLGAVRGDASLAEGAADHRLVEFRLGALRCEASPALGMVDHTLMELMVLKLSNKV